MAKFKYFKYWEPKVGDLVYEGRLPKNPGRITAVRPKGNDDFEVDVTFLDGSSDTGPALGLKDFKSLVEDAESTAKNHRNRLKQLEK